MPGHQRHSRSVRPSPSAPANPTTSRFAPRRGTNGLLAARSSKPAGSRNPLPKSLQRKGWSGGVTVRSGGRRRRPERCAGKRTNTVSPTQRSRGVRRIPSPPSPQLVRRSQGAHPTARARRRTHLGWRPAGGVAAIAPWRRGLAGRPSPGCRGEGAGRKRPLGPRPLAGLSVT